MFRFVILYLQWMISNDFKISYNGSQRYVGHVQCTKYKPIKQSNHWYIIKGTEPVKKFAIFGYFKSLFTLHHFIMHLNQSFHLKKKKMSKKKIRFYLFFIEKGNKYIEETLTLIRFISAIYSWVFGIDLALPILR